MARPIPTLGYRSRKEAYASLSAQGLTDREIAQRAGVTEKDVYYALRYRRGQKRKPRVWGGGKKSVLFPADVINRLHPHALKRKINTAELARRIISVMVTDNMVDAVLDDAGAD